LELLDQGAQQTETNKGLEVSPTASVNANQCEPLVLGFGIRAGRTNAGANRPQVPASGA
jgi:hypothetical protein